MIKRIIYIGFLLAALGICCFLFVAYSDLLDFFPWGDNKAYVVWEPLVIYFILPFFIIFGIVKVLVSKRGDPVLPSLLFLIIAFLLSLPVFIGFVLETDAGGRWTGVLTAILSVFLIVSVIYQEGKLLRKV